MVTGWRLIWLITFVVFILILLVLVKWSMRKGRDEIDRNRVWEDDDHSDSPDMP